MNFKDFYHEYEKLHDRARRLNKKSRKLQITVSIRIKNDKNNRTKRKTTTKSINTK
jgi:hypothetical protein